MPYLVTCPKCGNKLKSAQPVPAGRAALCPLCKTTFTLSAPAPAIDLPVPPPAACPEPVVRTYREDDPNTHVPRPGRRVEVEDDDPARVRPTEDDADDARPRSRRRRDEEDEDRPPPRRDRPDRDRGDDDRPQPLPTRRKSRKGLVLVLLALFVLFLMCAGGALTLYYFDPFGVFGRKSSADLLAWMPADTQIVEGMDAVEVAEHPRALATVRGDVKDMESLGIKTEDMVAVLQGKKSVQGGAAEVTVVRLKAAPDKDKVVKGAGGTEATANGKTYYRTRGGGGIYFPSDKVVIFTKSENTLVGLIQKEEGKVVVSDDLKAAAGRADGHRWVAVVGPDANAFGRIAAMIGPGGFASLPAPRSRLTTAQLAADELAVRMELTFADADTARKATDEMNAFAKNFKGMVAGFEKGEEKGPGLQRMRHAAQMFETMNTTANGPTVTITMTGPIEYLEVLSKGGGFAGP